MSSKYRKRSPDGKSRQEKLKEINDQLEAGVSEVFTSDDNFKAFLECCSRFHSYSVSNCILILSQCPEASYVVGYVDWNRKFGRHVKKGAKQYSFRIKASGSRDSMDIKDSKT